MVRLLLRLREGFKVYPNIHQNNPFYAYVVDDRENK